MHKLKTKLFIGAMVQEAKHLQFARSALQAQDFAGISRGKAREITMKYFDKYGRTVLEY